MYYINYYIIRLEDWELCIVKLNDLVSDDEISPLLWLVSLVAAYCPIAALYLFILLGFNYCFFCLSWIAEGNVLWLSNMRRELTIRTDF